MTIKELEKTLKSNKGYKRFKNPFIRYAGGKSLAVGYILNLMPNDVEKVISPFFGGGSVEIALSQACGIKVDGFDIFEPLVLFWDSLINNKETFIDESLKLKADKETYEKIRLIVSKKEYNDLPDLEKAIYFYYNHNLSYGPGFPGWPSSVYLNQSKWVSKLKELREIELKNLSVKRKTFSEVIIENKDDFLYLDPPYHLSGDMFKGIYPSRNRPFNHKGFDHELLCDLLKKHNGKWILSYNNCDTVKELYKDYNFSYPVWQYTMGQGETRIGANRLEKNMDHIKDSHEILITNF
jgi:DNA adenine methylase